MPNTLIVMNPGAIAAPEEEDEDEFKSEYAYGTAGYFRDLFANYPPETKVIFVFAK